MVLYLLLFLSAGSIHCKLETQNLKSFNGIEYEFLFHSVGQSGSNKFTEHYLYVKNIKTIIKQDRANLIKFATNYSIDNDHINGLLIFNTNNINPEAINFRHLILVVRLKSDNGNWHVYEMAEYSNRIKKKCVGISVHGIESECN
jgi:hypothetical protein